MRLSTCPATLGAVAGLDTWPGPDRLQEIVDPRLSRKLADITEVQHPRLDASPMADSPPGEPTLSIGVWRFPEWLVVQEPSSGNTRLRSRRLVPRKALDDRGRFETRRVVPTRFVGACHRGHIADVDWRHFAHRGEDGCARQLWLDERGTGGDLGDLTVRCECGRSRPLYEATELELNALGSCDGARPCVGAHANEACGVPSRLLIRTASNAYFPHVMSALSLPEAGFAVKEAVTAVWADLQIVDNAAELAFMRKKPAVAAKLTGFTDQEVLDTIIALRDGDPQELPVKEVELDALLAAPEGYDEEIPMDPDFHARRLPEHAWRRSSASDGVASIVQLHRLRRGARASRLHAFRGGHPGYPR